MRLTSIVLVLFTAFAAAQSPPCRATSIRTRARGCPIFSARTWTRTTQPIFDVLPGRGKDGVLQRTAGVRRLQPRGGEGAVRSAQRRRRRIAQRRTRASSRSWSRAARPTTTSSGTATRRPR